MQLFQPPVHSPLAASDPIGAVRSVLLDDSGRRTGGAAGGHHSASGRAKPRSGCLACIMHEGDAKAPLLVGVDSLRSLASGAPVRPDEVGDQGLTRSTRAVASDKESGKGHYQQPRVVRAWHLSGLSGHLRGTSKSLAHPDQRVGISDCSQARRWWRVSRARLDETIYRDGAGWQRARAGRLPGSRVNRYRFAH